MGKRREGRQTAVQFLFQRDLSNCEMPQGLQDFWTVCPATHAIKEFATNLILGVLAYQADIDALIRKHSANYELHRIAAVDRNILRVAIYEMFHCPEVPPVVAINEAIEIAKQFGSEDSGKFVNGILDRIRKGLNRPARSGSQGGPKQPAQSREGAEGGSAAQLD